MRVIGSNCVEAGRFEISFKLQDAHLNDLNFIIRNDILPNLRAARTGNSLRDIFDDIETTEDITQLAARIAVAESSLPTIIDEFAHQACIAGVRWEEDQIDFYDVTDRIGRLQIMAHRLSAIRERPSAHAGQNILLMPSPQETHVFGLSLIGMAFCDANWTVTQPPLNSDRPGEWLARFHYDVVGLSLSTVGLLPLLRDEISRLRRMSRNQSLCVLVGGSCFDRGEADFRSVGADAYAPDACSAPAIASGILNEQKLICARSAIS